MYCTMYCTVGQSAIKVQHFVHISLKLVAVCETGMYDSLTKIETDV